MISISGWSSSIQKGHIHLYMMSSSMLSKKPSVAISMMSLGCRKCCIGIASLAARFFWLSWQVVPNFTCCSMLVKMLSICLFPLLRIMYLVSPSWIVYKVGEWGSRLAMHMVVPPSTYVSSNESYNKSPRYWRYFAGSELYS